MKKIPLTQGKFAIVDDEDYKYLSQWKWSALKNRNKYYAVRNAKSNGKRTMITMHRQIMQALPNLLIDHINGDGLDNRKGNLRICQNSDNQYNGQAQNRTTSSKYKGVSWSSLRRKWRSQIGYKGKKLHLGYFDNEINAAKAYDIAAQEYAGKFARINFKATTALFGPFSKLGACHKPRPAIILF